MKLFSKDQQVIALMLGLTILFIAMFRPFHQFGSMLRASHTNTAVEPRHKWIVEVAGAVKNPGIYTFDMPPTVYQAIQRSGGSSISECNLSLDTVADTLDSGMRIELHGWNAECTEVMITPMNNSKLLILGIPIELNQASVDEIAMIPGISHNLAGRIIEYKESHGDFKTWNDLRCVKGVGPKKVEYIRSYLYLK